MEDLGSAAMGVEFVGARGKEGAAALHSNKKIPRLPPPKNFAAAQLKEFMAGPGSFRLTGDKFI